MMLIDIRHKGISIENPHIGEFVIIVLEQARASSAQFCGAILLYLARISLMAGF
jgi:hypothetical protein